MEYEKVSDTEFKKIETKIEERKYNITDLKNDKAIYLAHRDEYQAKADAVDVLLAQAAVLGVTEPQPIEGEIVP